MNLGEEGANERSQLLGGDVLAEEEIDE